MIRSFCAAGLVAFVAGTAAANPCGFSEAATITIKGYPINGVTVPKDQQERLARFAETAKERAEICVFAQVDKTGSEEANRKVSEARANGVVRFLRDKGVAKENIQVATQEAAFTFFGLLPEDQSDDRRVVVSHD
ncbi:MAG: OmpA family protein [Pseudomonadota bacterium]